ncbi:H-NS family histone-like protein, partial [Escherichia coli]
MSVMLQSLNNIRTLRAMAREFSIDVLEEMSHPKRLLILCMLSGSPGTSAG